MFNFSMLQLACERYVWLCIANGKAITEVHNRSGRGVLPEQSCGHECNPHEGKSLFMKNHCSCGS
jgi:hypothetical protein